MSSCFHILLVYTVAEHAVHFQSDALVQALCRRPARLIEKGIETMNGRVELLRQGIVSFLLPYTQGTDDVFQVSFYSRPIEVGKLAEQMIAGRTDLLAGYGGRVGDVRLQFVEDVLEDRGASEARLDRRPGDALIIN